VIFPASAFFGPDSSPPLYPLNTLNYWYMNVSVGGEERIFGLSDPLLDAFEILTSRMKNIKLFDRLIAIHIR
jgi:hypothetical protein